MPIIFDMYYKEDKEIVVKVILNYCIWNQAQQDCYDVNKKSFSRMTVWWMSYHSLVSGLKMRMLKKMPSDFKML